MKKLLILFTPIFILSGCSKVLDIEDVRNYSADQVWNDANLANAYMANVYSVFGNWDAGRDRPSDQIAGISFYADAITITNGNFSNWSYANIRLINQAIKDVNTGTLSEAVKSNITAQALVLRAYSYFGMVVAHGGVPYITIPQDRYTDSLDVPRNSKRMF